MFHLRARDFLVSDLLVRHAMACLMGIHGVSVSVLVLICFNGISLNLNGISLGLTGFHGV